MRWKFGELQMFLTVIFDNRIGCLLIVGCNGCKYEIATPVLCKSVWVAGLTYGIDEAKTVSFPEYT